MLKKMWCPVLCLLKMYVAVLSGNIYMCNDILFVETMNIINNDLYTRFLLQFSIPAFS